MGIGFLSCEPAVAIPALTFLMWFGDGDGNRRGVGGVAFTSFSTEGDLCFPASTTFNPTFFPFLHKKKHPFTFSIKTSYIFLHYKLHQGLFGVYIGLGLFFTVSCVASSFIVGEGTLVTSSQESFLNQIVKDLKAPI
jgi:hypothetical protein